MKIDNAFVEQANRANVTGFGSGTSCVKEERQRVELIQDLDRRENLKTYFQCEEKRHVAWTINGDGTVTNEVDHLMWIQAPWGMSWQGGSSFTGEPYRLTWLDATRLFGRGTEVGLSDMGKISISASQIGSTSASAGYSRGSCRITFAEYNDWRLPTIADWATLSGLGHKEMCDVLFTGHDFNYDHWTATLRKENLPGWLIPMRDRIAWAGTSGWILDRDVTNRLPVMFMRTV